MRFSQCSSVSILLLVLTSPELASSSTSGQAAMAQTASSNSGVNAQPGVATGSGGTENLVNSLKTWKFFMDIHRRETRATGSGMLVLTKTVGLEQSSAASLLGYIQVTTRDQLQWSSVQRKSYCTSLAQNQSTGYLSNFLSTWRQQSRDRISDKLAQLSGVVDSGSLAELQQWLAGSGGLEPEPTVVNVVGKSAQTSTGAFSVDTEQSQLMKVLQEQCSRTAADDLAVPARSKR